MAAGLLSTLPSCNPWDKSPRALSIFRAFAQRAAGARASVYPAAAQNRFAVIEDGGLSRGDAHGGIVELDVQRDAGAGAGVARRRHPGRSGGGVVADLDGAAERPAA